MARTTIALGLIEQIRLGTADKEKVLQALAEASSGAESLRCGPPAVTVRVEKLRGAEKPVAKTEGIARGTAHVRAPLAEAVYDLIAETPLYRLSDVARVDVVRLGRLPDQDICLPDARVSREHGLIILADVVPLYCDYGSLVEGKHAGSTNGTYLDGAKAIRDAMIQWLPSQSLHLGSLYTGPTGRPTWEFRVTYEIHFTPPDDEFGN